MNGLLDHLISTQRLTHRSGIKKMKRMETDKYFFFGFFFMFYIYALKIVANGLCNGYRVRVMDGIETYNMKNRCQGKKIDVFFFVFFLFFISVDILS